MSKGSSFWKTFGIGFLVGIIIMLGMTYATLDDNVGATHKSEYVQDTLAPLDERVYDE